MTNKFCPIDDGCQCRGIRVTVKEAGKTESCIDSEGIENGFKERCIENNAPKM